MFPGIRGTPPHRSIVLNRLWIDGNNDELSCEGRLFLAIFYQQFFKRVTLLPVIISMPRPWVIGLIGAYGFLRQRVRIADRHSLRVADIAGVVLVERPGGWRSQNRR